MTPQEWIQDVRESIERDDEPRLLLENLKVGADHLAAALEEIAYIRPILEASEAECRRREEQDLVWRTKYTLLENEIARLRAEAGRVVVPELTPDGMSTAAFVEGYRFAASRAHSVPSSRVLKDGEVAVGEAELAALREFADGWSEFRSQFDDIQYHHSGMGCGIEDRGIHDRYAACEHGWECAMERVAERFPEIDTLDALRTQATATESGEKGGAA